jgi:hypothetical protein
MLGLCSEHVLSMSLAQSFRHTTTVELDKRPLLGLALPIWSFHFAVVNWILDNRLDTGFTRAHARAQTGYGTPNFLIGTINFLIVPIGNPFVVTNCPLLTHCPLTHWIRFDSISPIGVGAKSKRS